MERIKLNIQKFADNTIEVELTATIEKLQSSISKANSSLSTLKKGIKNTKDETYNLKSAASDLKKAFSGINLSGAFNSAKKLIGSLYNNFLTKAVDTSEELNLFNVVFDNMQKNGKTTFSELGKEATQFQNKLNEAFGTNKKETMRYQGLFQAMGESAGLKEDIAALMSENMTKLSYDLASLYNTTETKAAESLRAGVYAGQTKPLRNYGIDVTQTSFKPIMEELGLEKSVNELTQAEKEVLRYISTLRQAQNAMGDFANTVESPANQLKVLRQQFYEMQAAIGNLFVGAFARILPYVNAVIMAIKEVAKAIASFFGIEMQDYNTGIASYAEDLEDYSEGLGGVSDAADGASNSIKALKRQTLGFDQINNLTSPTPTSGSSGGGGGAVGGGVLGGIDDRLLEAIKGYDNGMDKIKMKATEIRDKLMDFLGFTKHINSETGEVYFTYDGWQKTVKNLWDWFTKLNPLAKFFVGLGVGTVLKKIWDIIKKISNSSGLTGILKILKTSLTPLKNLVTSMGSFAGAALKSTGGLKNLKDGLSTGIQSWREQEGIINKTTGKLNGFKGVVSGTKNVLLGLGTSFAGYQALSTSMRDIADNGANALNVVGAVGGALGTVFGGVQAGAVFGPWGAAIGGITGAIVALGGILGGFRSELKKKIDAVNEASEATHNYAQELKNQRDEEDRLLKESLAVPDNHKKLLDELKLITDENGKVKKGYEDRAQFIVTTLNDAYGTEIKIIDGTIQELDNEIKKIDDLIEKKKAALIVDNYGKRFEKFLEKEEDMWGKVDKQVGAVTEAEKHLFEARKTYPPSDPHIKEAEASYEGATKAIKEYSGKYIEALIDNDKYERMMVAEANKNYGEVEKIRTESYENSIAALKDSMVNQAKITEEWTPEIVKKWQTLAYASKQDYMDALSKLPDETVDQIQILTGQIVKITPAVVDHFAKMASESEDEFMAKLALMPEDMQKQVIDELVKKGAKLPKDIQDAIDEGRVPVVNVNSDVSSAKQTADGVINYIDNGTACIKVTADMQNAYNAVRNFGEVVGAGAISAMFRYKPNANGGIFANGRWQAIQAYANGGLPSGGQLFMAREAGPELVGKIGRHTAVMNNNQIVDSVKAGVYEAVSAAMSSANFGGIEFVAHTDEGVVIDRINKITRQTGECPINI